MATDTTPHRWIVLLNCAETAEDWRLRKISYHTQNSVLRRSLFRFVLDGRVIFLLLTLSLIITILNALLSSLIFNFINIPTLFMFLIAIAISVILILGFFFLMRQRIASRFRQQLRYELDRLDELH